MPTVISREELVISIASHSSLVIEALGEEFFRNGHLPTAVNLPLQSPDPLVRRTVGAAGLSVVVYGSASGEVAQEMAQRIEQLCGCDVFVYPGGKEEWVEAGLPIERSDDPAGPGSDGVQERGDQRIE